MHLFGNVTSIRPTTINWASCHKYECNACPLDKAQVTCSKTDALGASNPLIYVLGSGITKDDETLYGKSYHNIQQGAIFLRNTLKAHIAPNTCRFNHVYRTYNNSGKKEMDKIIECCRPSIERDILSANPKIILLVGQLAFTWATGHKKSLLYNSWRGRLFPVVVQNKPFWARVIADPEEFVFQDRKYEFEHCFKLDIQRTADLIKSDELEDVSKAYVTNAFDGITINSNITKEEIDNFLLAREGKAIAFDIETLTDEELPIRRFRVFGKNTRIYTCALSDGVDTLAFNWNNAAQQAITHFLLSNNHQKVAHNLVFDLEWLAHFTTDKVFNLQYQKSFHDTMAMAYVLDGRHGKKSLGDQCLLNFGVNPKKLGDVDASRIQDYPINDVIRYNGLDAKFTALLFAKSKLALERAGLLDVYAFQMRRIFPCMLMSINGININHEEVGRQIAVHKNKILEHDKELHKNSYVLERERERGGKFSVNSNLDVGYVLKKLFPDNVAISKNISNKLILDDLDSPFVSTVKAIRTHEKALSTYLLPFSRYGKHCWSDGKIHPQFDHTGTETRRLSSRNPNAQNLPKRADKNVRKIITAPEGYKVVSVDFSQIEVRVFAMATDDPFLRKAIISDYDMHKDWGYKVANLLHSPDVVKQMELADVRMLGKGGVVFPLLYGASSYKVSKLTKLDRDQAKYITKSFWQQFQVIKEWQSKTLDKYYKNGYVETLTGFRRQAPISKLDVLNTPIQGTASDIVIDAMCRLFERVERDGKEFMPICNIHDELLFYVKNDNVDKIMPEIEKTMLDCKFSFLGDIPLEIEMSCGDTWG